MGLNGVAATKHLLGRFQKARANFWLPAEGRFPSFVAFVLVATFEHPISESIGYFRLHQLV